MNFTVDPPAFGFPPACRFAPGSFDGGTGPPAVEVGRRMGYHARRASGEAQMPRRVLILVGTRKGVFILEGDEGRRSWAQRGPLCETWPMNHVKGYAATGTILGAGGNECFGPAVWQSTDLGASWTHSSDGLAYPEGETPI